MGYDAFREQLKRARREQALSQQELAARSGTSRVTIARLESGSAQDVRVGTVSSLCEALGLEIVALPPRSEAAHETILAREKERARRLDRRLAHAVLAARLLGASRSDASRQVRRARAVVDRWERDGLCSDHYVSRWRSMLAGPVERVARALLEPGEWADALFQNTPWSFAFVAPR